MAKLSIIVCDFCNSVSDAELENSLIIQKGSGKDKEVRKSEICDGCYAYLLDRLDSSFDFNSLPQNGRVTTTKIIADGETIVPSNVDNVTKTPQEDELKCKHDKTSFEPPNKLRCRDCGEDWKV